MRETLSVAFATIASICLFGGIMALTYPARKM